MTAELDEKPRLAVIPGDPSGIGPELIAKLLHEPPTLARADIVLIGDRHVFERGAEQAGLSLRALAPVDLVASGLHALPGGLSYLNTELIAPEAVVIGEVNEAGGRFSLRTLDMALDLVREGTCDAVLFGPFNKAALHMAGLGHDDELHYMASYLGHEGHVCELNTLDGMWTSRVTSHVALRDVAELIDEPRILNAIRLVDRTLKASGLSRPRIAVAGLNPHCGDNGNFGREEIEVIAPAVRKAAERQIDVTGPWPADTIFLKAKAGEVDAIVTMYHDQGQIALKLMGFDRGVTVQGGLPLPVATPAHGTAFDIAGKGVADLGATRAAFNVACDFAERRQRA